MPQTIHIDVFSDPVCPWCLLGLARLDKALGLLPETVDARITHHPFLLDANAPPEGEDVAAMLTRKYGQDPGPMWDRLEVEAAKSGIALDMRKQKMRYPSQAAQVLIAAAHDRGNQHALARALGDAHYLEARNISDPEVLAEIALDFGMMREESVALAQSAEAKAAIEAAAGHAAAQGVNGVPFFVFQHKFALSGAQPEEVFQQALEAALAEADAAE